MKQIIAPAKINLHLRVAPLAADGFHPLLSWMCTIGLFDTLDFLQPRPDGNPSSRFECDDRSLPIDERNLVVRAARALNVPYDIRLTKRVPNGAGLGGGSSDAAATLMALNPGKDLANLSAIAAALGSDVPFFLHGPSSICRGRGERVQPIAPPTPTWCLLILPGLHISTPAVYRQFDAMGCGTQLEDEPDWTAWTHLAATELLPRLVNDLEAPAFTIEPQLAVLRERAERLAGRPVRMSGSGSSLFTLFDAGEAEIARALCDRLSREIKVRTELVELGTSIQSSG